MSDSGAALRLARKAVRVSQTRVAKHAEVSRPAISAIEQGKRKPKVDELMRLASLLRFRPEQLLGNQYPMWLDAQAPPACYRAEGKQPKKLVAHDAHELDVLAQRLGSWSGGWTWSPTDRRLSDRRLRDKLRDRFQWSEEPPYDIFGAMYRAGVMLEFTAFEGIAGAVLVEGETVAVAISSDQPDDRQRWSAAHEFAHLLLGHQPQSTAHVDLHGPARLPDDRLADWLAGNLLLPADDVLDGLAEAEREHPTASPEEVVFRLAHKFAVSYAAMAVRLGTLQILSYEGVQELRKAKPSDLARRVPLPKRTSVFQARKRLPAIVARLVAGDEFSEDWHRDFDMLRGPEYVRRLQQEAVRDYVGAVPIADRKDSVTRVFEAVAVWVAETYPLMA
ncbi:MAG: ImmA/IrrE family metallo-endopeptidase [Myxococcales bacterium]|nr:ImmA/IrrE family metallo-endopeptidase [Myxococcales bacterium]